MSVFTPDTTATFIKQMTQNEVDAKILPELRKRISQPSLLRSNRWRLATLPGASDLLYALIRRSLLPDNSPHPCPVNGCTFYCTANHILTCSDPAHLAIMAPDQRLCDPVSLFGRALSACEIITQAASNDLPSLMYIAIRVRYFTDDELASRWSTWFLWSRQHLIQ